MASWKHKASTDPDLELNSVNVLTALFSYLRRQFNPISELQATCPKILDARWLSMKKLTTFFEKFRRPICTYLDEKSPACKPTTSCWVVLLALDRVSTELPDVVSRF